MDLLTVKAKKNLTWLEISARCGISSTSLSLIARGCVYPKYRNRLAIEKALGTEIDWISTRIRKPLYSKTIKKECPEDTVISALYAFIKIPGDPANRFAFLYEFLTKLEEYLTDNTERNEKINDKPKAIGKIAPTGGGFIRTR